MTDPLPKVRKMSYTTYVRDEDIVDYGLGSLDEQVEAAARIEARRRARERRWRALPWYVRVWRTIRWHW